MSPRERTITLSLVAAAFGAWTLVALLVATVSPAGEAIVQLAGAVLLGSAVMLTLWPLLWATRRAQPGSLITAGRRGGLAGLVVGILVVLRLLDVVSLPVVAFLVVGAVLVEAAFSLRRS